MNCALPSIVICQWPSLDQTLLSNFEALLDNHERKRLAHYRFEADQQRFLVGRGLLKTALSFIEPSLNPKDWHIRTDKNKPYIDQNIDFSISHSGDWVVVGLSRHTIGIDVEEHKTRTDILGIAKRYFTKEEYHYLNTSKQQTQDFFTLWTLKEAYLKATGVGLNHGLDNAGFDLEKTQSFLPGQWTSQTAALDAQHQLSIVMHPVERSINTIEFKGNTYSHIKHLALTEILNQHRS